MSKALPLNILIILRKILQDLIFSFKYSLRILRQVLLSKQIIISSKFIYNKGIS
jgi:hypothetical protein